MTKKEFEKRLEENKHENKTFVCIGLGDNRRPLMSELDLGGYDLFEPNGDGMAESYDLGDDEQSIYFITEEKSKEILERLGHEEELAPILESITNSVSNLVYVGVGNRKNPLTKMLGIDKKDLAIKVGDTFMFGKEGLSADYCHYVTLKTYMEVVERNQKKPD